MSIIRQNNSLLLIYKWIIKFNAGPLVVTKTENGRDVSYLYGVVSGSSIGCGYRNIPSLFGNVNWVIGWIKSVMSGNKGPR